MVMLPPDLSEVCAWTRDKSRWLLLRGRIPMAQAVASSTDELLSQLAASEIDRLLAEADGNSAPDEEKASKALAAEVEASLPESSFPADDSDAKANGSERAALLQAAGFESAEATAVKKENSPPQDAGAKDTSPVEDERSAV